MNYSIPSLEEYEKLIPVARALYEHNSNLSWQMLLPLFLISVGIGYSSDLGVSGAVVMRLKRLVITVLLLILFPSIAEFSQIIGVEIAKSIDDMTGIDQVLEAASKRADKYSFDLPGLINLGSDLLVGSLVILSFVLLVIARFFLLAFQHFYWFLLVALGPFLILGTLFESCGGVTKGLFKSMFQISAWPIVWSVLSAFLKALPFVSVYGSDSSLITVVTLNLIIAVALLFSPMIVSQLSDGVNLTVADTLRKGAFRTVMSMNPKTLIPASLASSNAHAFNKFKRSTK